MEVYDVQAEVISIDPKRLYLKYKDGLGTNKNHAVVELNKEEGDRLRPKGEIY